jgi:hypothetical protein
MLRKGHFKVAFIINAVTGGTYVMRGNVTQDSYETYRAMMERLNLPCPPREQWLTSAGHVDTPVDVLRRRKARQSENDFLERDGTNG